MSIEDRVYQMELKHISARHVSSLFKLTVLSTAVALAGCGGGGGFYGSSTPSPSTTPTPTPSTTPTPTPSTAVATNYHIVMSSSKPNMVVTGDTAVISVKLVDANGGGVASQNVTLSIPDTLNNSVTITGASTVTTDANGNATFTITMPAEVGTVASGLITNGLRINASFTDTTNKVTNQTTLVNVVPAPAVVSVATQSHLVMSGSKSSLWVTGDSATITVKLLDQNGGGIANQNVVLSIPNAVAEGVSISGPSQGTTDSTGTATFTVALSGNSANTASLLQNGVTINATFTDATNTTITQTTLLNVIQPQVTPSPATLDHLIISTSKATLTSSGDSAIVTVKLADQNGGAVAGQNVVLSLPSAVINEGVSISGASSITTDANGNAAFTVNLQNTNSTNAAALIASGIALKATFTDSSNASTSQSTVLNVKAPSPVPTTALYHLVMSETKATLSVNGDSTTITVKAVDANGGGVANQNITLTIPQTTANGTTINGPSTVTTDQYGNAAFTVNLVTAGTKIDTSATGSLVTNGIEVDAALTDVNGNTAHQVTTLNVVPPSTPPIPNITLGNSAKLATSSDSTYYYETFSANVVDGNGNAIANQPVSLSISISDFSKGYLSFGVDPTNGANSTVAEWYPYVVYDKNGNIVTLPLPTPPNAPYSKSYTTTSCSYTGQSWVQNAVTFVGTGAGAPSTDTAATFVTNSSGAFSFSVRFLRRYAFWQDIKITATTTSGSTTVSSNLLYGLMPTLADVEQASGQPYTASPYGTSYSSADCSNQN